jgi:hypothetical protein
MFSRLSFGPLGMTDLFRNSGMAEAVTFSKTLVSPQRVARHYRDIRNSIAFSICEIAIGAKFACSNC